MRAQSGFGLLEAIVALALIAATGLALFSWVDTNLAQASRLRDRDAAASLQIAVVEFMGSVNPVDEPHGQRTIGRIAFSWDATAQGTELPGMGFTGLPTNFRLQLFDTDVNARDGGSGAKARFTLTLLGYRHVDSAISKS